MDFKRSARVGYFYQDEIEDTVFGEDHPMKPFRLKLTHDLIQQYSLYERLHVYKPPLASEKDLTRFHHEEYVQYLKQQSIDQRAVKVDEPIFNFGVRDCPVFKGLYRYCCQTAGASIAAAMKLNKKEVDVAINWSGGFHHAKKCECAGFCFVNDIVLAIVELLKVHERVLYVDIDVHHGDGVEEAFYCTNRVFTLSFHQYEKGFFPESGALQDRGAGEGLNYAMNIPIKAGIDGTTYVPLFKKVVTKVNEKYRPQAIVIQCGADSLAYDELGDFNLTIQDHSECLRFVHNLGLPLLVLGGGGYTIANVARCWTYETATLLNVHLSDIIPRTEFREFYSPSYRLTFRESLKKVNTNTQKYIDEVVVTSQIALKEMIGAPSVQFHTPPK